VLLCTGADNNNCLTAAQVAAVRTVYSEHRVNGNLVYPGWDAGGEDEGWPGWLGNPPTTPRGQQFVFADGFAKYWLTGNPSYDTMTFLATNYQPQLAAARLTLDASPDLSAFFALGGKLMLVHGTHDWAISYKASVNYFNNVAAASGGTAVRDAGMEFYLLPGVQHCGGGVGPFFVDYSDATIQWVETGARPSSRNLSVFGLNGSGRPLCHYPNYPRYNGTGHAALATSFTCTAP
jgi:feruloyl esterase